MPVDELEELRISTIEGEAGKKHEQTVKDGVLTNFQAGVEPLSLFRSETSTPKMFCRRRVDFTFNGEG